MNSRFAASASEGLKFLTCFSLAGTWSSCDPVTEPCSLSVPSEFHRDDIHCWALPSCPSCIHCLLWSLAQGCLNPTPKLPLPRIHTHGLHSCSLEVGGRLLIPENTHSGRQGWGGVHKYMFLLCLPMVWLCFTEAERKTHFKNVLFVYVSMCMCKHLWLCTNNLGLEEGTGFPGVGVTVSWVGNTQR